jgi:hypothetical protein
MQVPAPGFQALVMQPFNFAKMNVRHLRTTTKN